MEVIAQEVTAGRQALGGEDRAIKLTPPLRLKQTLFCPQRGSGLSPRPRLPFVWILAAALCLLPRMGSLRAPSYPPGLAGPEVLWQVAWAVLPAEGEGKCPGSLPAHLLVVPAQTCMHTVGPELQTKEGPALPRCDRPRHFPAALPARESQSSVSSQELRTPSPQQMPTMPAPPAPASSPYPQAGHTRCRRPAES